VGRNEMKSIIELAREAGGGIGTSGRWILTEQELTRFAHLVRAEVLEEAAGIADEHAGDCYMGDIDWHEAKRIAAAIRALKEST
jgi:hypothetical protein